ncbi:hypothetical protein SGRA_0247 [Saprospira grandis str. Lewin]|uniref:Uncharacterized protein n=1 Tax=Saprospira grandis (strain Lewin) TaxID=984262 RepID=H6L685_SAPGL|nr:hypothetical protein SGRA_0247 [Saprospira grandis str. Lewin]
MKNGPNGPALRSGGAKRQTEQKSSAFLRRAEQTCEPRSIAAAELAKG